MRTVVSLLVLLAAAFVGVAFVVETWLRRHEVTTAPGPSLDQTEMHPMEEPLMPRGGAGAYFSTHCSTPRIRHTDPQPAC